MKTTPLLALLAFALLTPLDAQLLPPDANGITMGHIHMNVRDIAAQKKFWIGEMHATEITREGLPGVKLPGMLLLFTQREPTGGTVGTVLDHLGFKVRSRAEIVNHIKASGYQVTREEYTGSEGFPNANVIAPDDIKLELQQDTALAAPVTSHHLHYFVVEPVPLRDWYVNTFGFKSGVRGRHQAADVPGQSLNFQPNPAPKLLGTKGRSVDHIGFEVKNLEAFCKKLEAAGIKFDVPYRKVPNLGLGLAFLTDPSGVYIELTEGLDKY